MPDPRSTPASDMAHMRAALEVARQGASTPGCTAIGCVIVLDGRVVGTAHNEVGARHDPTAHAEIVAIRRACAALGRDDLRGATLYSTLQPCGMCAMASIWAGITGVVYGARRQDVHQMYFEDRHLDILDLWADAYRKSLQARTGILADECAALLNGPDDDPPRCEQANL